MKSVGCCLKGLIRFSRSARGWVLCYTLLGLLRIAVSLTFVWVCKELVDLATNSSDEPLGGMITLMVLCIVLQIFCRTASSYCEQYARINMQNRLRLNLFGTVMSSRWSGRERFSSGDAVNRLEEDIRVVSELLCSHIPGVIVTLFQLVAASTFLLFISPQLLWVLLGLMVAGIVASRLSFRKLRKLSTEIRTTEGEIQQHIQEHLQNRVVALTIIGIERVLSALERRQKSLKGSIVKRLNFNAANRTFLAVSFLGGYAAAFLWGIFGIRSGAVTFGMMTAFLQLVNQIQMPVAELARELPAFIHALSSIERLLELEELEQEENAPAFESKGPAGVRFENVSFSYPDSKSGALLKNFSHNFAPSTLTVIAGATGIGKSTMVRLMLGLLSPQEGSVTIYSGGGNSTEGGADYAIAGKATRGNFKYVPQGNTLMSGTILENLQMADPNANREEIEEVLRIAAADFVFDLPDGLQTMCGESGSGLSEGQCQRIAIARALLQRGSVLLLDESTSSLDPQTEAKLLENLRRISNHTIIFISHREAVMQSADSLLRL